MDGYRCRRAAAAVLAGVLLAPAAACSGPTDQEERYPAQRAVLQRLLDRQATAVHRGDARGFLAAVSPAPGERGFRAAQTRLFGNLQRLPLRQWTYQVLRVTAERDGGFSAQVRLGYRLRGYDRSPVTSTERLAFDTRRGHWYLTGERAGSARQLWDEGRVQLARGRHSLVLGTGHNRAQLRAFARAADRAVPEVTRSWPRGWPRRVVLEVPDSLGSMARMLAAPTSSYAGIAAVTTGEAGTSGKAPADRIIINPEAYRTLSAAGRQVVLIHETVHVATRTQTTRATPLWLSEGIADWAGNRSVHSTPRQGAPELARAVRKNGPPARLPTDEDFRFGGDQQAMSRAYEGGWLACRMVADRWGADRLTRLYREVGAGDGSSAQRLERALRDVLHLTPQQFVHQWRGYLRQQLG